MIKTALRKIPFIVLVLVLVMLASCSQEAVKEDMGEVKVLHKEEIHKESAKSELFTPIKDPFGIAYKEFALPRASLSMRVPENWEPLVHSSRHISFRTDKDPLFNNMGFSMLLNYETNLWDMGVGIDDNYESFSYEVPALPYYIGDYKYHLSAYYPLDNIVENAKFCKKDGHVLYGENLGADIDDEKSMSGEEGFISLNYYVRWRDDCFIIFSSVCQEEDKKKAKSLMDYIVSNMKSRNVNVKGYQSVDLAGFKLNLPDGMVKTSKNSSTAISPIKSTDYTSGAAVTYLKADEKVSKKTLAGKYGADIAMNMMTGPSNYNVLVSVNDVEDSHVGKHKAKIYRCSVTIDIINSGLYLDEIYSYHIPSSYNMDVFYVKDLNRIIASFCHKGQPSLSSTLESAIKEGDI